MRRWRIYLAVGGVFVAVVVGLGVWAAVDTPERRFAAYVAELRAAGEPTTIEELAGPPPDDAENAATEITAALSDAGYVAVPPGATSLGEEAALSDKERREAELLAAGLASFVHRVAAALDRPRCRFTATAPRSDAETGPAAGQMRSVIVLLEAVARSGPSSDDQIEACRTLLRLGARIEPASDVERRYAGVASLCGVECARRGVESGRWDARRARSRLDECLVDRGFAAMHVRLRASLVGELAVHHWYVERWERLGVLARAKARLAVLRGSRRWALFGERPPEDVLASAEVWRRASRLPAESYLGFRDAWSALRGAASVEVDPAARFAERDALLRLARVGLAVAERRTASGVYPSTLDEVRGAFPDGMPLDPFTDGAFRYDKTRDGVVVWTPAAFVDAPPPTRCDEFAWTLAR